VVNGVEIEDRTPASEPPPRDVTPSESGAGLILYHRPAAEGVFLRSSPTSTERIATLTAAVDLFP